MTPATPTRCHCGYPTPCPEHPVPAAVPGATPNAAAVLRLVEIESKVLAINRELIAERDAARAALAAAEAERDAARVDVKCWMDASSRNWENAAEARKERDAARAEAADARAACYQVQDKIARAIKERNEARAEAAAAQGSYGSLICQRDGAQKERDSARLLLKDAEERAAGAAADLDVAVAATRQAEKRVKEAEGRCCKGENPECESEKTVDRLRGELALVLKRVGVLTNQRDDARANWNAFRRVAEGAREERATAVEQARRALVVAAEWEKKAVQLEQEMRTVRGEREALRAEVRAEKKRADAACTGTTVCCVNEKSGCVAVLGLRKSHDAAQAQAAAEKKRADVAEAVLRTETTRLGRELDEARGLATAAEERAAAAAVRYNEACIVAGDSFNRGVAEGRRQAGTPGAARCDGGYPMRCCRCGFVDAGHRCTTGGGL